MWKFTIMYKTYDGTARTASAWVEAETISKAWDEISAFTTSHTVYKGVTEFSGITREI